MGVSEPRNTSDSVPDIKLLSQMFHMQVAQKFLLPTLGTSPSVKSTGLGACHLEWDRKISHASSWTNGIVLFSSRIVKKASVIAVVAMAISAVSAQEFASAPAPSPLAGGAYSVPASGVMIGTSILLSFVALFRN
ncbi:hypothetical protein Tco_1395156 [Tanacetum coccineum]